MRIIVLIVLIFFVSNVLYSGEQAVGFVERTGDYVPLNLEFYDETGQEITLGELFKTPVLLMLVYYRCPGICTPLLSGVAEAIRNLKLTPGKNFIVITISFDERENFELAGEKKRNYLNVLKRDFPPSAWRFLTGKKESINRITSAVGFRYKRDGDGFIHPAGVVVLSQDGKIIRYIYGTAFLPFDFRLSLLEASSGNVLSPVNRALKLCFKYDPKAKRYVFDVLKLSGLASVVVAGGFLVFLIMTSRKRKNGDP